MNQTDYANDQRGGIPLRDYTQGRRSFNFKRFNFDQFARGLIWVSMGIGLMELLMPKHVQKLAGVRRGNYSWLIRFAGLRELMTGMLIFIQGRPQQAVWSRVVGDAMDLGLLGAAFTAPKVQKNRLGIATGAIAGITALDAFTGIQMNRMRGEEKQYSALKASDLDGRTRAGAFRVMRSITITGSPEALYQYWRNFANLPNFMYFLQDVQVQDDTHSHWVTKAPAGQQVEWDAEITDDQPNRLIAWQSTANADVPNSGVVRFEQKPNGQETVVRVEIEYRPPGGSIGRAVAKLVGEAPGQQVWTDLKRFKEIIETGEVVRSDATPQGFGQKMQRPGQPMTDKQVKKIMGPQDQDQVTADYVIWRKEGNS